MTDRADAMRVMLAAGVERLTPPASLSIGLSVVIGRPVLSASDIGPGLAALVADGLAVGSPARGWWLTSEGVREARSVAGET